MPRDADGHTAQRSKFNTLFRGHASGPRARTAKAIPNRHLDDAPSSLWPRIIGRARPDTQPGQPRPSSPLNAAVRRSVRAQGGCSQATRTPPELETTPTPTADRSARASKQSPEGLRTRHRAGGLGHLRSIDSPDVLGTSPRHPQTPSGSAESGRGRVRLHPWPTTDAGVDPEQDRSTPHVALASEAPDGHATS